MTGWRWQVEQHEMTLKTHKVRLSSPIKGLSLWSYQETRIDRPFDSRRIVHGAKKAQVFQFLYLERLRERVDELVVDDLPYKLAEMHKRVNKP